MFFAFLARASELFMFDDVEFLEWVVEVTLINVRSNEVEVWFERPQEYLPNEVNSRKVRLQFNYNIIEI